MNHNTYWLYTRENMYESQELRMNDPDSLTKSNFNVSKNTVFVVHGWKGNGTNTISRILTSAFLSDGDVNVIVVDYSTNADLMYILAMEAVNQVGEFLGLFIDWLNTFGMSYETTHLVGFSLGAHVVGLAGRFCNGAIKRITALDPAGPLWYDNENRIQNTDADYVEVIHTNMLLFGFDGKIGDADFYPNGGIFMPECSINACSHSISYIYMAQ
ncbi:endothelial lipase, partial [Manduca sexta]|uniref:endothelial lipase n=1 Tax=Manduca sexta TaxID=7130 RepID=UPI00188EB78F